jgi:hypothetical protein
MNASKEIPDEPEPHQDERQIRLDTDRSFVLYPVGDAPPYLTPDHSHSPQSYRRWSRRCSVCTSGRAQQTHCSSFPATPRFELFSGQLLYNFLRNVWHIYAHIGFPRYCHRLAVDNTSRTRPPCTREPELAPTARLHGPHSRTAHSPHAVRLSRHYYVPRSQLATVFYSVCCDLRIRPMPHYWKSGYFDLARVEI